MYSIDHRDSSYRYASHNPWWILDVIGLQHWLTDANPASLSCQFYDHLPQGAYQKFYTSNMYPRFNRNCTSKLIGPSSRLKAKMTKRKNKASSLSWQLTFYVYFCKKNWRLLMKLVCRKSFFATWRRLIIIIFRKFLLFDFCSSLVVDPRLCLRTSGLLIGKMKCGCNPDPFTALFCRLLVSRIYAIIIPTLNGAVLIWATIHAMHHLLTALQICGEEPISHIF